MQNIFTIGDITVQPGEKYQGMYKINSLNYEFPLTIIHGENAGKVILITAGIHGGEYVGIQAAVELACELTPQNINGTLIIAHCINITGFYQVVSALFPEANENLNRLFPGKIDGGFGREFAHHITEVFHKKADFYFDLHGGDLHEEMTPFVFYPGEADEEVTARSKEIAKVLNMQFMLKSQAVSGSYNSAARLGIPSILIERGGCGRWSKEEVVEYKNDILRALVALKVFEGSTTPQQVIPIDVTAPIYLEADVKGCWYPEVVAGDCVSKGQFIGCIKGFFQEVLAEYYAAMDGIVLYRTTSLAVTENTPLVAYVKVTHNYNK